MWQRFTVSNKPVVAVLIYFSIEFYEQKPGQKLLAHRPYNNHLTDKIKCDSMDLILSVNLFFL